jgi:enediyne biosynthesis protein E4
MKKNLMNKILERSRPRWPFQRHSTAWLSALTLCLLGYLPPATADPNLNPNYPKDANVSLGAAVSFLVSAATANPPMTFQWQHEGTNVPSATNSQLIITNISVADAGGYVAWITNASGGFTNSRTAILTVDPTFTKITTGPVVAGNESGWSCSWADYDGDGDIDLLVNNGGESAGEPSGLERMGFFRNDGSAGFVRLTNEVGSLVGEPGHFAGGVWADYDNDGALDCIVTDVTDANSKLAFHRNLGNGTFRRETSPPLADGFPGYFSWVDYDNDGWLDVFDAMAWGAGVYTNTLFHASGSGRFTSVNTGILVQDLYGFVQGTAWGDYDGDGDQDLVATDMAGWPGSGQSSYPNHFYRNDGGGVFTRITNNAIALDRTSSLIPAWADYDNDGKLDLFITSYGDTSRLFHNEGNGQFTRILMGPGLATAQPAWGDFDNDGDLDLYISRGQDTATANLFYLNNGNGTFSAITSGSPATDLGRSVSCIWGDYDNDGFLDLFVANIRGDSDCLYHNNGNGNHWLMVKLVGTASNRSAIGAKVRAYAMVQGRPQWQLRDIQGGNRAQNDQRAHFGLGDATNVDLVRIEWPSGNVQELQNVAPNRIITVTEATLITPAMPSASLNGSVTLTRSVVSGATYQWRLDGVDLVGQTNRILNLTNIVAGQEGRYSVVASNATTIVTNYVYLHVDTQFTKITQGPIVNDLGKSFWPAWGDYDGDGWLDLFVANYANEGPTVPFLYRNDQQGGFVRVTAAEVGSLATDAVQTAQGVWADYDNDGDQDLFIGSQVGPSRLYVNEGNGHFIRVTQDVGINRALQPYTAAWADYDNDGFVDLYLASGWISSGVRDTLWRNLGDGTFQQFLGIPFPSMEVCNGTWGDADNDGDLDLLVGGFSGDNVFYRNQGNGTFTDDPAAGLGVGGGGAVQPVWADFNNDGWLDVFLSRNNVPCYYFQNKKDGTFQWITTGPHTTIGGLNVSAGDYDNDGDLDLFITRGQGSGNPSLLLRNEGDGTFVSITCGSLTQDRGHFTGCAWADYDNDGALDLIVNTVANEKNALFHNNGNNNGWLIVRLVGTRSNRDAIGAKVRATATVWGRSTLQTRQIGGGAIGDPRAHFGLGNASKVTTLRIEWPSGAVQEIPNVAANQVLTVYEPPALAAAVRADGACELTIKAEPNRGWQIQASSDLLTWQTLTNVTSTSYQFQFSDPAAAGMDCRFYRLQSQ